MCMNTFLVCGEKLYVNPRMLGKPRLQVTRCANDQHHRSPWEEYMFDTVTFEDQIAVFEDPPGQTGILAGNWYENPHCSESPDCELQDAQMISAIGVCVGSICPIQWCSRVETPFFGSPPVTPGFWREFNLRTHVCSESPGCELQDAQMISAIGAHGGSLYSIQSRLRIKTPFFGSPPVTPGFWREFNLWTYACSESPGCELQDVQMIRSIGAHGGSLCSIQSRLRIKTPFFGSPPVTPGFWRELNLCTHVCSESLGCELQDAPMISSIGECGGRICPIQCCLRVETPHFDGLVRVPLTGPRH